MMKKTDKRIFNRLKTNNFKIEYKIMNDAVVNNADVINLSAGGICFLRTSILEKGDILQIKFQFHEKKIILTGEIIRVDGREVAVRFLDDEQHIEKFVESFNTEFWGGKNRISKDLSDFDTSAEVDMENHDNIFDIGNE